MLIRARKRITGRTKHHEFHKGHFRGGVVLRRVLQDECIRIDEIRIQRSYREAIRQTLGTTCPKALCSTAAVARISIGAIAVIGFVLIVYLSTHGYDRAVLLIPTWFLLLIWVAGIGFILLGRLQDELAPVVAVGVIVILVMLVGFTVMQHAFSSGVLSHALVSESERKALALNGSGDSVFDWDVISDKVTGVSRSKPPCR